MNTIDIFNIGWLRLTVLFRVFLVLILTLDSIPAQCHEAEESVVPRLFVGTYLPSLSDEINLSDIKISMEFWIVEIAKKFNITDAHVFFFNDISDMRDAFEQRTIDMIVAAPLDIVRHFDINELSAGIIGNTHDENEWSLVLLVNKRKISDFMQLKGKRLLLPEGDELPQVYADFLTSQKTHLDSQHFFSSVSHKKKSSRLILDLFFGQVDATIVYRSFYETMVELNPQIGHDIDILETYPIKCKTFAFFNKHYPYAEKIYPLLDKFPEAPRGKQLLEIFKTDRLSRSEVEDLESVVELYRQYNSMKYRK